MPAKKKASRTPILMGGHPQGKWQPLNVKKMRKSIVFSQYKDEVIEKPRLNFLVLEKIFMKSPTMVMVRHIRHRAILPRHDPAGTILEIIPRFRVRCTQCKEEYQTSVTECIFCKQADNLEKSELVPPEPMEKQLLRNLLRHPNEEDTDYDILTSNLSHDTFTDEWMVSLDFNYEPVEATGFAKRGLAKNVYVENPAYIFAVEDVRGMLQGRTWHCPFHSSSTRPDIPFKMYNEREWLKLDGVCPLSHADIFPESPNTKVRLEKTAWVQNMNNKIRAAFSKNEIVFGSTVKNLPLKRAFPRAGAAWRLVSILDSVKDLNWEVYSQGHVTSLLVFQNMNQAEINTLETEAESALRLQAQYDPITGDVVSSKRGYVHWIGGDEIVVQRIPLLDPFTNLQTLDFYREHLSELFRMYGILPIFHEDYISGDPSKLELEMLPPAIQADQGSILDKWNNRILPAFGVNDWIVTFREIREKDRLREAQRIDFLARAALNLGRAKILIRFNDDGTVNVSGDNSAMLKEAETGQFDEEGKPVEEENERGEGQRFDQESERTNEQVHRRESPEQQER